MFKGEQRRRITKKNYACRLVSKDKLNRKIYELEKSDKYE